MITISVFPFHQPFLVQFLNTCSNLLIQKEIDTQICIMLPLDLSFVVPSLALCLLLTILSSSLIKTRYCLNAIQCKVYKSLNRWEAHSSVSCILVLPLSSFEIIFTKVKQNQRPRFAAIVPAFPAALSPLNMDPCLPCFL